MSSVNLPEHQKSRDTELNHQIAALSSELEHIEQKTLQFESVLRSELASMLIQVQELTVLYKQQKQAKKAKRLEQKKRGKNYKVPEGLKRLSVKPKRENKEEDKQLKQLYREAMLHVHPDKFSMEGDKVDLATEVTTKLIDIYNSGDLSSMKSYHAHIFSGNALEGVKDVDLMDKVKINANDYLIKEKERLEQELLEAKARHTYQVLIEYDDPMTFLEELRVYYRDRVSKLKRRTRS